MLAENIDIKVEGNDYYILDYDNYTIHKFTETKEVKNVVEDEVITYTITVTNTGDLAKGITVNVAEGQTVTLSFEVLVHYMDINTTISNTAYVDDYATNRVDTPYINPEAQIGCNIVKNGTSTITNADQLVEYEITYTASIKDYIGNAEVVIVDTLPYEIDETKSDLAGGTYDARAKTITWTESINNLNTIENGDNQINITKKISVVYKGLNSKISSLTNKVQGSLNLLDTGEANTVETEFESKVNILSRVIVRYVNEFGYEIGTMEIIEGPEGTTYVTHFKDIENYEFLRVEGNTEGILADETQEVTYVYKRIEGKVIVRYLEKDNTPDDDTDNVVLAEEETISGYSGDAYETSRKEIDGYQATDPEPENAQGTYTQENIEVIYFYTKQAFNLGVEKNLSRVILNGEQLALSSNLTKVEIVADEIQNTNLEIAYTIKVTNNGEIEGTADVIERLPQYFSLADGTSSEWQEQADGTLKATVTLLPGETKELNVVLSLNRGENNLGVLTNIVELANVTNPANFEETTLEDNTSKVDIIVTVKTGGTTIIPLILTVFTALTMVVVGIVVIKKKVL